MTDEKRLTIIKGEEFKISVKEKIDCTDIFYDQYISAARMLDASVMWIGSMMQRRKKEANGWTVCSGSAKK